MTRWYRPAPRPSARSVLRAARLRLLRRIRRSSSSSARRRAVPRATPRILSSAIAMSRRSLPSAATGDARSSSAAPRTPRGARRRPARRGTVGRSGARPLRRCEPRGVVAGLILVHRSLREDGLPRPGGDLRPVPIHGLVAALGLCSVLQTCRGKGACLSSEHPGTLHETSVEKTIRSPTFPGGTSTWNTTRRRAPPVRAPMPQVSPPALLSSGVEPSRRFDRGALEPHADALGDRAHELAELHRHDLDHLLGMAASCSRPPPWSARACSWRGA